MKTVANLLGLVILLLCVVTSANAALKLSGTVTITDVRIHPRPGGEPTLLVKAIQNVHTCRNANVFEMYNTGATDGLFESTHAMLLWALAMGASVQVYYDDDPSTCYLDANAMLLGVRVLY